VTSIERSRRLSQHFDLAEFDSGDGARVPAAREADVARLVFWWLEPLRAVGGAVTVHSGYRSERHNAAVGGARASVHMLTTKLPGRFLGGSRRAAAADVTCTEMTPGEVARWAAGHRRRFAHLGPAGRGGIGHYATFTHLDTATARDWRA
jgi:hypothetical protein